MRGVGVPPAADAAHLSAAARVYLRAPARSDREEFTELMRNSRAFHSPWATAPTDDERFAAYLADARRADFEAMLLCRTEDDAITGFFNLSQIVRRRLQSAYLGYAVGQPFAAWRTCSRSSSPGCSFRTYRNPSSRTSKTSGAMPMHTALLAHSS